ncbi:MAG: ACP S-malonyltransferase [Actinomycetota bacterium]|nr:ACP S-malonyltransferase [Actinomycetota bacterium]
MPTTLSLVERVRPATGTGAGRAPAAGMSAFVFPGQGSQTADMRESVRRACPHLLDLALSCVGDDPFECYDQGTRFLQPAMYCASVAAWVELGAPDAECLTGHSMGEISALVAAGSLTVEEGLELVAARARLMQLAADAATEEGGMLAVALGLDEAEPFAERWGLTVANDNAPAQVVLSGPRPVLTEARDEAKSMRVAAKILPVRGALHSPAMEPAVEAFQRAVRKVDFSPPRLPVYSCVTAEPFDDIPKELVDSLTHCVRWREIVLRIKERGVSRFVEVGPGRVLTGLIRRTLKGSDGVTAERGADA